MTGTPHDFYGISNRPEPALWTVRVSESIGAEYKPLLEDAVRMICIQATIQLMSQISGGGGKGGGGIAGFFSPDFVLLVVYVILGVMLYWLAVRRMVAFT